MNRAAILLLCGLAGCAPVKDTTPDPPPAPVRLGIPGTVNRMPSLAVSGNRVVAVWTSTLKDAMDVYAAISENGGATFSTPQRVNDRPGDASSNAEQPPRVAVTQAAITVMWPSRLDGTSAMRLARSTDGGRTFSHAMTLHDRALTGARGWHSLTPGRDGAVHAVWLDGRDADPSQRHQRGAKHAGGAPNMAGDPRQDVYQAVVSPDGAVAESHVARDVCYCCKTAVALGPGGRVNVAWRHIFPESIRDIAMATSPDGGRTFSPLARVSEDKWQLSGCPDDGPAMAVGSNDAAHLVWPTLVNQTTPQKAIFYTTTMDGRTFAPRTRLSGDDREDAAHPQIAVGSDGNIAAVWDEQQGDTRRVVARLASSMNGSFGPPQTLNEGSSAFYPHVISVRDGFAVAWAERAGEASAIVVQRVTMTGN